MARESWVSTLALCGSFFALGVIGLGAFTRLIDAGLGCPDWPGCYGHLTAPMTAKAQELASVLYPGSHIVAYKALAEMVHRYFAGCLGLLVIGTIGAIFRKDACTRQNVILALCLLALLIYQIILGQLTVTLKLLPIIVTQHLLGGYLILSVLWLIYLNNHLQLEWKLKGKENTVPAVLKNGVHWPLLLGSLLGIILLLIQIILGAWTSTNYASLSCPSFPFCMSDQSMTLHFSEAFNIFSPVGTNYEGGVLSESIRQTIQMTHRWGAGIITVYLLSFMIFAVYKLKSSFELMKSIFLVLGLLILQLCIGMSNIIFKLPLITAVSHNLTAVLLLLALITFTFKIVTVYSKSHH